MTGAGDVGSGSEAMNTDGDVGAPGEGGQSVRWKGRWNADDGERHLLSAVPAVR
jgi:hypothetical protein